ncbi:MAG: hypothetical protein V8S39_08915 [Lachnospiraceae bacterium]
MKRKRILQKLANCISYDIKEGIVRFIPLYALTGVFVLAFGWDARMHLAENVPAPSVLDLAVYMFQGMDEYVYVKGGPPFDIPISFLTLSFCFALFACYYAHREWKLRGTVYIPRYESKMYFWISKCIWCILQMILLYLMIFVILWGIAAAGGNISVLLSRETLACLKGLPLSENSMDYIKYIFGLGLFTAIVLNQIQLTAQMIFSPVIGYILVIAVITSSAYFYRFYMPGNYYMLLRTALFREDGITLQQASLVLGILWIVLVLIGAVIVRKKDVL